MSKQSNSRVSNTIEAFLASEGRCMELNLSNQMIDWSPKLCSTLVSTFKISRLLQCINLHGTHMSSDVLNCLVEGLAFCKRLVTLDLSNNNIDDEGARAIAQLISNSSKRMSLLSLHVNEISDIGSEVISTAILESRTSLSTNAMKITLYNNNLTETGVTEIQKIIGSFCNIEAQPQKVAEGKSSIEKSPSKTGVLVCSPKKIKISEEEARLKLEEEARLKLEEETRLKVETVVDIDSGIRPVQYSIKNPLLQAPNNNYDSVDKADTNLVGESDNCCCCVIS